MAWEPQFFDGAVLDLEPHGHEVSRGNFEKPWHCALGLRLGHQLLAYASTKPLGFMELDGPLFLFLTKASLNMAPYLFVVHEKGNSEPAEHSKSAETTVLGAIQLYKNAEPVEDSPVVISRCAQDGRAYI